MTIETTFNGALAGSLPPPHLDVIRESLGHEFTYWANSKPVLRDGAVTKPPIDPKTGRYARMNEPGTLGGFDLAARNVEDGTYPWISAALTEPNGIIMLDVDNAPETLKRNPEIRRALARYRRRGGYVEQSQSRNGFHAFVRGTLAGNIKGGKLEAYNSHRHFVVTGFGAEGGKVIEDQDLITTFAEAIAQHKGGGQGPDKAHAGADTVGAKVTADLLDKATETVRETIGSHIFDAGDWAGATLQAEEGDLWTLTAGTVKQKFPSQSEADEKLCGIAARELVSLGITDEAEVKAGVLAIMERSALSHRDKWRNRAGYREDTISKVVAAALAGKDGGTAKQNDPALLRGDILAGEYYIRDHRERLRYCPERGSYLGWNAKHWEWASHDDAIELGKETAGKLFDLAKGIMQAGDADKGGKAMRFAARYHSIDGLTAMVRTAKSAKEIRVNFARLDADAEMLCARNGYGIHLRTGQAFPPDRAKFFTRVAGVDYDAEATCPQWQAAMLAMFEGDQETVDFLQRAIGYTATGYNNEEVFFCCFGHGENGKSVMQDTLTFVLGGLVCTGDVGALLVSRKNDTRIPNALAATAGARMLSLNETVGGDELDTRSLKLLAGREPISARFLHQEYFSFVPTATPWLRTNHRPIVKDDTHGTWRRIVPIPFRHQFTDADRIPDIEHKLRAEGSGILNWIIAGAVQYFKQGLNIPTSIRREAQGYRSESDVLGQFLEEQTTADPTFRGDQAAVWSSWRNYCASNGHHPGTKNSLSRRLKERGFPEWKSNGRRFYRGLAMRGALGGVARA